MFKAKKIIRKFKPNVVIGTGGFASGPTLFMASRRHIPSLIQEQNSYPGITNKMLASKVKKICVAYDGLERFFPADKLIKTGNPVRQDLLNIDEKREEALTILSWIQTKRHWSYLEGALGPELSIKP